MKTNATVRIIIWSLVIVVLLGILLAGLGWHTLRSRREIRWEQTPVETEAAFGALPNDETISFPADTIREIEIVWVSGDIILLPADTEEITISESDVSDRKYSMVWKQTGEKLEILFSEDRAFSVIGIHSDDYISKDLYIRVPQSWECNSLEVDAAAATLEVRNMTIREVDFDGASGTCDFVNCSIKDLDIDTASGDVTFSGTLGSLDFDAASASFIGEFQNTPDRIDMDSMSGSLDIALPEDCGYSLSIDGMNSSFRSDFQGMESRNGTHIYGDGHCTIQVDGMSCDVTIRKLETIYPEETNP